MSENIFTNWKNPFIIEVRAMLSEVLVGATDPYADYSGADDGAMHKSQAIYDNERELYAMFQMESFNMFGIPFLFHVLTYDVNYDRIFGEDCDKRVERVFAFMGMPEGGLPANHKIWTAFMVEGADEVRIFVNKEHFKSASSSQVPEEYTQDNTDGKGMYPDAWSGAYVPSGPSVGTVEWDNTFKNDEFSQDFQIDYPMRSYIPRIGDIVQMMYNKTFYEITNVDEEDEMFHQQKHSWTFTMKKYINESIEVVKTDLNYDSGLDDLVNSDDVFDNSDKIDDLKDRTDVVPPEFPNTSGKGKPGVLYDQPTEETPPDDFFGGF